MIGLTCEVVYNLGMSISECIHCGRLREIKARLMCGSCYNRAHKNRARNGVPMPDGVNLSPVQYLDRSIAGANMCWPWAGPVSTHGYGTVRVNGTRMYAHRWIWETQRGTIPDGMTLDHVCRSRSCVNPEHLEVVTRGENLRRAVDHRTPQVRRLGHGACDHNGLDVYTDPSGKRVCRECRRERTRLWRNDPNNQYTDKKNL